MTEILATNLIVPGRGHVVDGQGRYGLSPSGVARVSATLDYFSEHEAAFADAFMAGTGGSIVMSGGYASLASGDRIPPLPYAQREASLMFNAARAGGIPLKYLHACASSTRSLENILRVQEEGHFGNISPENPLGIVTQPSQWERFRWFAKRIFEIPDEAVVLVPALGEEDPAIARDEKRLLTVTKVLYGPARTPAGLRRAERVATTASRIAEKLGVQPPAASYLESGNQ